MTLHWRAVTELHLNDDLIPNPNAGNVFLTQLYNVKVAVEGGFLHVDPRQDSGSSQDLFMVPAAAVLKAVYREPVPAEPFMVEVQTG
jgi:hypothetical protein